MQCLRNLCAELVSLNKLAASAVLANTVDATFHLTTVIIFGQLGKGHLAAGAIALAVYNIPWYFLEGLLTAQDNLVARAHSLKNRKQARYWSYIACAVALSVSVLTTLFFIFGAEIVQHAFSVRKATAGKVAWILFFLLPGFCCHAVYLVLQKYLLGQKQMRAPLVCGAVGIVANIIGGYVLSFTLGLNFAGCAIAFSAARALMLLIMISSVLKLVDMRTFEGELTELGLGLRARYYSLASSDVEGADSAGGMVASSGRGGPSEPTSSRRAVTNKPKQTRKGKKARIAPTTDTDSEAKNEEGLEMVPIITERLEEGIKPDNKPSAGADAELEAGAEPDANDDAALLLGDERTHSDEQAERLKVGLSVAGDVVRFLTLGIPGAVMLGVELWIFDAVLLFIAHMGSVPTGAVQILITTTTFFYHALPFALSVAASVQIHKHLAKKRARRARTVAYLCLIEAALLMALPAGLLYLLRAYYGYVFSGQEDILYRLRKLTQYATGFQMAYGVYGAAQGILRATSRQLEIFGWTVVAVWLVGLPVGLYLALVTRPTYELRGIWIGLIVGMGLLAVALVLLVLTLDWEKEARRAEFRLRAAGLAHEDSNSKDANRLEMAADEPGIVMNPLGSSRDRSVSGRVGLGLGLRSGGDAVAGTGVSGRAALTTLPAIGSRAVGGFPLESLFRTAADELAEFEYVEFGNLSTTGGNAGDISGAGREGGAGLEAGGSDGPGAAEADNDEDDDNNDDPGHLSPPPGPSPK